MSKDKNNIYEKLTPQRKALVDMVLKNLESGELFWKQNWGRFSFPESAISGKKYRGINNLFLTFLAIRENYKDNRWMTFHQMSEKGWKFKTDEEGKNLAKGKGAVIEYFEFHDTLTKTAFTKATFIGMSEDEQEEYWRAYVRPYRKYYRVFNGDLIEGIPQKEVPRSTSEEKIERAEEILKYWNEFESPIIYEGNEAYYSITKDEIHLPPKEEFYTIQDFYGTAFHEIGHSTGSEKRLNRDLSDGFGSEKYAIEELRAEIASMFIEQDLGIEKSEQNIRNNSAYIQHWKSRIEENPNVLFNAIADAEKITKYVLAKGKVKETITEENVVEEESEIYIPPSVLASQNQEEILQKREVIPLTKMSDVALLEKVSNGKGKEQFEKLYKGEKIFKKQEKNDLSLMMRIAMYTPNDKEQIMRVFASSGQFNEKKGVAHYATLLDQAVAFIQQTKKDVAPRATPSKFQKTK